LSSDDGGSTYLCNVGRQLFYTAVHPRRKFWTSYSPPWELEISQITRLISNIRLGYLPWSIWHVSSERRCSHTNLFHAGIWNYWTINVAVPLAIVRRANRSRTVHRSRVAPRKECGSCGNARFRERK
jgi:hypothetical protein